MNIHDIIQQLKDVAAHPAEGLETPDFDKIVSDIRYTLVSNKRFYINARLAGELLQNNTLIEQRKKQDAYINQYGKAMKEGDWSSEGVIIIADTPSGLFLLNGQHRLHAIAQYDVCVLMHLEYRKYSKDSDARLDYTRIDQIKIRTPRDKQHILGIDKKFRFSASYTANICTSVEYIVNGFEMAGANMPGTILKRGSVQERAVFEWQEEARIYQKIIDKSGVSKPVFTSAPMMSVALFLLRFQRDEAVDFFTRAICNKNLSDGSPEWCLNFLVNQRSIVQARRPNFYAKRIISLWNAFYCHTDYPSEKIYEIGFREDDKLMICGTPACGDTPFKFLEWSGLDKGC